jgi:hypothetical protein
MQISKQINFLTSTDTVCEHEEFYYPVKCDTARVHGILPRLRMKILLPSSGSNEKQLWFWLHLLLSTPEHRGSTFFQNLRKIFPTAIHSHIPEEGAISSLRSIRQSVGSSFTLVFTSVLHTDNPVMEMGTNVHISVTKLTVIWND